MKVLILFILFQFSHQQCLKDLTIEASQNRSIILSWNYDCFDQANLVTFKIYYEHVEYKACTTVKKTDTGRGAGRGNLEVEDVTQVEIPNLHPYSLYNLSVKALPDYKIPKGFQIPEEKKILGETLQGVPNVRPVQSSINTRLESTSLKFYWAPAPVSKCEHFNAFLDGYRFVLKGIDSWNVEVKKIGTISEESVLFENLMPFSNYILFIYVKTAEGLYNPDLHFKIPAETKSSDKAGTPRNLRVIQDGSQHHLSWLPPYPPTGIVSHYVLRWKSEETSVWSGGVQVQPSSDLCSSLQVNYTKNEYEKRICHTLEQSTNVSYQVAAYNAGSRESSDWTVPIFPHVETTSSNLGIIVIGTVVGIVVLGLFGLSVVFLFSKCNTNRYKNVPHYSTQTHTTRLSSNTSSNVPRPNSLPPPWTPPLSRQSSGASKYQHLLLPVNQRRPSSSIQETPLPPLPMNESIYEELNECKQVPDHIRVSFNKVNEVSDEEEGEFLKPRVTVQDEDGYLQPKKLTAPSGSEEEDDEYLAPTFNKFKRVNSRDLNPPQEEPDPIPMQSYVPVPKKEGDQSYIAINKLSNQS